MENKKYIVRYYIPGRGGGMSAVVDAPDGTAARNMAERMFGNVTSVVHDPSLERRQTTFSALDDDDEHGPFHSMGRTLAREHLGVIGDNLSDRAISILFLLALGSPVVGLWLGLPIYKASLLAPTMGFPPVTLGIGTGLAAFCVGWLVLYLCPIIILRAVGLAIFAGWFVFYASGWRLDVESFQNASMRVITTNTDATNFQKLGLLAAGLVGAWILGNLGKATRGS